MRPSKITKSELDILNDFVTKVNESIIKKSGGALGTVNIGNLSFALWKSLSLAKKELHKKEFHKIWATNAVCEIAQLHPFTDGNKRTSYVISKLILYLGGLDFEVDYEKATEYLIKIASKKIHYDEVYNWIEKHSKEHEMEITPETQELLDMLSSAVGE